MTDRSRADTHSKPTTCGPQREGERERGRHLIPILSLHSSNKPRVEYSTSNSTTKHSIGGKEGARVPTYPGAWFTPFFLFISLY